MGEFHPFHWFVVLSLLAFFAIPVENILKRTGHDPVWSVFFAIPLVNLIALWIFAFMPWPIDGKPRNT